MKSSAQKIKSTTQKFTEILDIQDDMVLLSGGNACLIIEVKATNFALLSAEEQDAKIYSYAALLNSLSFPIQIVIKSQKLDINSYLKLLDLERQKTQNPKLAEQIKLYRDFVQELVKINIILDKKFYIVINYSYLEGGAVKAVGDKTDAAFISQARSALHSKAESLHSQLGRLNLHAKTLSKEELIKLYFETYNETAIQSPDAMENIDAAVIKKE